MPSIYGAASAYEKRTQLWQRSTIPSQRRNDEQNKREISNKSEMIAVGSQSNIVLLQLKRTCPITAISICCRKRNMVICA